MISENRTRNTTCWHFNFLPAKWITPHKIVSYQLYSQRIKALAANPTKAQSVRVEEDVSEVVMLMDRRPTKKEP